MYEVLVNRLEITGHHGVTEGERTKGCKLKINVSAEIDGSSDETDEIEDTVDYGELTALIVEVNSSDRFRTLEKLAKVFIDEAFVRFPTITSIEIQINKLDPPVPDKVESLGVRMTAMRPA